MIIIMMIIHMYNAKKKQSWIIIIFGGAISPCIKIFKLIGWSTILTRLLPDLLTFTFTFTVTSTFTWTLMFTFTFTFTFTLTFTIILNLIFHPTLILSGDSNSPWGIGCCLLVVGCRLARQEPSRPRLRWMRPTQSRNPRGFGGRASKLESSEARKRFATTSFLIYNHM